MKLIIQQIPKKNKQYKFYYYEFLNIKKNLSNEFNKNLNNSDINSNKLTKSKLTKVTKAASSIICITNEKNKETEKEINQNVINNWKNHKK